MAIAGKITLHIVTPDQSYSHQVDEVVLPGAQGDFGVLPGHTPFFTSLRTGQMWYRQGAEKHFLAVSVGFVEVLPDRVSVLSQVAQRAEDLDQAKAEAGMQRAEEMMGAIPHEMDFETARLALLRTLQQLQAEVGAAPDAYDCGLMFRNLAKLLKYRGLIQTLVVRDLKARYRGSVLGFFWSFFNPLLLLLIYSFVFTVVLPGIHNPKLEPYALFMFCGILPWTWFSSSLLESSNTLIAGGNLIKKVLFPAEVLPIVTVLANMVHFFLGLPILAAFLIYYRRPLDPVELLWFPVIVFVQLLLSIGLALFFSAMTVHFRDLKDLLGNLLTLWFFATPIIYPMQDAPDSFRPFLNLNPMTHLVISYQEVLFFEGPYGHWKWLLSLAAASLAVFFVGYFVFDRLRDSFAEEV